MQAGRGPLLTRHTGEQLLAARAAGAVELGCSLDLGLTTSTVTIAPERWSVAGRAYPYPGRLRERTIYYFDGDDYDAVARYGRALVKLVPTEWGAPTFEIDGIKMLPSARISPFEDARAKIALVEPSGCSVLDTCAGLGYFAACAASAGARSILSFEASPEVLWLRELNPWSPPAGGILTLVHADVVTAIASLPTANFDAALHDPPRFGIAGELYSASFYGELARVLRRRARLFHYTGTPNRLSSGRDVPGEVLRRLAAAGFTASRALDGVLAVRR